MITLVPLNECLYIILRSITLIPIATFLLWSNVKYSQVQKFRAWTFVECMGYYSAYHISQMVWQTWMQGRVPWKTLVFRCSWRQGSRWKFSRKLSRSFKKRDFLELPYDSAIPLLSKYQEKIKTLTQKDTHSPMLITSLFTITNTWKQCKCSSTNG